MYFFPACHPLRRTVARLTVLGVCVIATVVVGEVALRGVALAAEVSSSAAHVSVLVPDRALAAQVAPAMQVRKDKRVQPLPTFLHGEERNPTLLQNGLLTKPARQQRLAKAAGNLRIAQADSVCRVLLVRVGFQDNRAPSLTSMPTTGDFMAAPDSTIVIDPPPHDADYWQAQLLALQAFYLQQSAGQLRVEGSVFPPVGEPSIKLSDVADYGPGAGGFWTLPLLETYFRDAVALLDAEAAGKIDLSSFDSYVIAHPGADLQTDVLGNSPNDIPTFFITLGDSIPVMGGTHEVRNGLVMPETTSQDGLLGGILGALCHEFGHNLGLPDWYDTHFGYPSVGEWSLMDSGNAAFFAFQVEGSDEALFAYGLLPLGLSAYDRYLLGWDEPHILRAPEEEVHLLPWSSQSFLGIRPPTAARLDVSPEEYFLIENRRDLLLQRPDLGDVEPCPYLNRDEQTGVILWLSKSDTAIPARQRRNTGDYDFFISSPTAPDEALGLACGELGFGVLVWHVDERVLFEGLPTNEVNVNRDYRALRVIEASGDFEIGDLRQVGFGFRGDAWSDVFRTNFIQSYTKMTEEGTPNSWNSDWARSGWEITDVHEVAPESQAVTVRVREGVPGWPQLIQTPSSGLLRVHAQSAVATRIGTGPGSLAVVLTADSLGIFRSDSTGSIEIVSQVLDPASLAYTPELVSGDANGTLAALDGLAVHAWGLTNASSLVPRAGFPMQVPGGTGAGLILLRGSSPILPAGLVEKSNGEWLAFTGAGEVTHTLPGVLVADYAGPVVGKFAINSTGIGLGAAMVSADAVRFVPLASVGPPTSVPLDLAGSRRGDLFTAGGCIDPQSNLQDAQVVVLHRDGRLRVVDPQFGILHQYPDFPRGEYLGVALADVTGDGVLDIVAATATQVHGLNANGARLLNTPLAVQQLFAIRSAVQIVSMPGVADVTGDALPEFVFTTDLGLVYILDADGSPIAGYPRKMLPDDIPGQVLVADVDDDASTREVVAVSDVSISVVAPAGGDATLSAWTHDAGDAGRTRYAVAPLAQQNGSDRLLALEKSFQAYPNPARGSWVRLRFTSRSVGPFDIRIYNLEGEQVFNRMGNTVSGPQEVEWNVEGLASGVYLCRVHSAAAGVSAPLIEPITVVR